MLNFKYSLKLFILLVFGSFQFAFAQLSADSLMQEIAKLQVQEPAFYFKGQFKSQRFQSGKWLEDNNIFFSASVAYTLQNYQAYFDTNRQIEINNMINNVASNYPAFCAKENLFTCNFWVPKMGYQFPGSPKMSSKKKYMLADDMDDTALLLMTGNFSSQQKQDAANFMTNFTTTQITHKTNGVPRKIRSEIFYSTWFGKKMPLEFDLAVECNVLLFKQKEGIGYNKVDSSTFDVIEHLIVNRFILKRAHLYSANYEDRFILYYHIARFLQSNPAMMSHDLKKLVITHLLQLHDESNINSWERLLISNALLMLGQKCEVILERPQGELWFFVANLASTLPKIGQRFLRPIKKLKLPYRCEAFELALVLEHAILQKRVIEQ